MSTVTGSCQSRSGILRSGHAGQAGPLSRGLQGRVTVCDMWADAPRLACAVRAGVVFQAHGGQNQSLHHPRRNHSETVHFVAITPTIIISTSYHCESPVITCPESEKHLYPRRPRYVHHIVTTLLSPMPPRSASGGRGAAASTAVASSSNAHASTSKSTISPLRELTLLQHINGIRQVPNFVAFDIFAQSTGADWMEGMLAQAKDIRRQWS